MTPFNLSHYTIEFAGFFLAGMAVNLTPCVYPLLTVTVSLFKPGGDQAVSLRHSFAKAFLYFLGMAFMYSGLGVAAAFTGQLFGSILQNNWVLFLVAAMMLALSFSMFGAFQISVPSQWLETLSRLRSVSYTGFFISGLFVGVFAAPCIGPPVIALLAAVAKQADPVFGFFAFFVFSLGLGLPYLILGTYSHLLVKLPKAGHWLHWVEHGFGVALLGFSAFYFMLALKWPNSGWVVPGVLFLGGIYLGFIESSGKENQGFLIFKRAFGLALVLAGIFAFGALSNQKGPGHLVWEKYTPQIITEAKKDATPLIIDFYADWCIGCHELDQTVFSNSKIQARLKKHKILRVDATLFDDPGIQALIDKYKLVGLPTVLFIDKHGQEIAKARFEGAGSLEEFAAALDTFEKEAYR